MSEGFVEKLTIFAKRAVTVAERCNNEESTKLFLVIPFINVLGFDTSNPMEVCPEHAADFSDKYKNRVDFAILQNDLPIIAIECKCCGAAMKDDRGQLRSYFNAAPTVKMGILTDGLVFEFYADSDEPNMMDPSPFLMVNVRDIAAGRMEDSVSEGLQSLQKGQFDPENIGAEAKRKLVFQKVLHEITSLAEKPNEAFTRMLLKAAGIQRVTDKTMPDFHALVGAAFREFVNVKILQRLELTKITPAAVAGQPEMTGPVEAKSEEETLPSELEMEVMAFIKRRLAFLVRDEKLFDAIDKIRYSDYKGKFAVYFERNRQRLFDFFEGSLRGPKYRFAFADWPQEVTTDKLVGTVIDAPLLNAFKKRVAGEPPQAFQPGSHEPGKPISTAVPAESPSSPKGEPTRL